MGNIQISNPMMMARAIIAPPLACFVSTINITSSIVTMFFLYSSFSLIPPILGAKTL
jgi:hypothetical protein